MAVDLAKLQDTINFGAASELLTSDAYKKGAKLGLAMQPIQGIINSLPTLIEASIISDAFIAEKTDDPDQIDQAKSVRNGASNACKVVVELIEAATK